MSLRPRILFRPSNHNPGEIDACRKYCDVATCRSQCLGELVVGRYSVLPFYKEIEEDLYFSNCRLINSYEQHRYIANFDYYYDVKDYTFPTWNHTYETDWEGPFVVKGRTNSRKHKWGSLMFAKDKMQANSIASQLLDDDLIKDQGVIFRKYIPLKTFEIGINEQPFTNEWRIFYLGEKRLAYGYYWSLLDDLSKPYIPDFALELADKIACQVAQKVNFFVLDMAETQDEQWVLVEINDGQMSGLSMIDEDKFYKNLWDELNKGNFDD